MPFFERAGSATEGGRSVSRAAEKRLRTVGRMLADPSGLEIPGLGD
jgi:hypothetical protein